MPRPKRDIPWLDQRGGIYYARWYDESARATRGLSLRTKNTDEAQRRFSAFLAESHVITGSAPPELSVSEALNFYLRDHIHAGDVSAPERAEYAIVRLEEFFGNYPVSSIDVPMCREYVTARKAGKVGDRRAKPGTIARELSTLRAAAHHCIKWKKLTADKMPSIELPRTPKTKGSFLFPDELDALRAAAPEKSRWFIDLAYFTGSRKTAIETLKWEQVDLARRRIHLRSLDQQSDTTKRRPPVPIDARLMPTLEALHTARVDGYVLPQPFYSRHHVRMAADAAGLSELPDRDGRAAAHLTPHVLRHSRATHLLWAGKSLFAVAGLLGDTVKTVMDVYGHHSADHLESLFDVEPTPDFLQ